MPEIPDNKNNHRVEFKNILDGGVKIIYFDDHKDRSYLSWELPKTVSRALVSWWKEINANKELCFPIKKIWSGCEFTMHAEDHVDIREFGNFGCYKMTGWSLPKVVVDELVNWHEKNKSKKANGQVKIEEQT